MNAHQVAHQVADSKDQTRQRTSGSLGFGTTSALVVCLRHFSHSEGLLVEQMYTNNSPKQHKSIANTGAILVSLSGVIVLSVEFIDLFPGPSIDWTIF